MRRDIYDFNSISATDLFEILGELNDKRLLGCIELLSDSSPEGFLRLSPTLTARLIKAMSVLPLDKDGRQADICFSTELLSLCIYECSFLQLNEILHLAKLSSLAGFNKKHKNGSALEFNADIYPKDERAIYAISKNMLRDIFKDCFPEL